MDETLIRGDVNELRCILDFQSRGYYCSIPFSSSCRYDVVVDINNHLYRIQCKSSSYKEDFLVMHSSRTTTNTVTTKRYTYSKEEIDYFYTTWDKHSFLLPVEEVKTAKTLRLTEPKCALQGSMCIASDYLLDKVLYAIKNNQPIQKFIDNRFISIDMNGIQKLWTQKELEETYSEGQIKYIKEAITQMKTAYNLIWKYKEFPSL